MRNVLKPWKYRIILKGTIPIIMLMMICFIMFGRVLHHEPEESFSVIVLNTTQGIKTLNSSDTVFYADAWRSHWCPYYNDREFYLTPRINELFNLLRSRGFKVMQLNWKGDPSELDSTLRKYAKAKESLGMTKIIKETYPWNGANNSKYIPGFKDKCVYDGFKPRGPTRMDRPNPRLSIADSDMIATSFKGVSAIAHYENVKTVILMGMHTNLCILSATLYLHLNKVSTGFLTDILDSGFYYPSQRTSIKSHEQMNKVCNNYISSTFGWELSLYELIMKLKRLPPIAKKPNFVLFGDKSDAFLDFYL